MAGLMTNVLVDGRKIQELRVKRGWSKKRLADESNVSEKRINQLELSPDSTSVYDFTAGKLALALGVDISEILAD
jgi:transcriptional regulator with XRE-family HTH domain